jgi:hypothetical protein
LIEVDQPPAKNFAKVAFWELVDYLCLFVGEGLGAFEDHLEMVTYQQMEL